MSTTTTPHFKAPVVDPEANSEIADGLWVIADADHTPLVPNIGIVVGDRATLVIDTGFGPANARTVLEQARRLSGRRPIFVTHTHCHPEHGFGANVIAGDVTTVYNETQWNELQEKGPILLGMFKGGHPVFAKMLEGVEFVRPAFLYTDMLTLDLGGGQLVELREVGGGHSRGDQVIIVRRSTSVLFTGDLVEEGYFVIFGDNESNVPAHIDRLNRLEQLSPDVVVPGHGRIGGADLIPDYRSYLELARDRVNELRSAGEFSEAEIADRVIAEVVDLHPDWQNRAWAGKAVAQLLWPARA